MIKVRIKKIEDKHKKYVDTLHIEWNYEVGDKLFLRVKPQKCLTISLSGVIFFAWLVGPFEII